MVNPPKLHLISAPNCIGKAPLEKQRVQYCSLTVAGPWSNTKALNSIIKYGHSAVTIHFFPLEKTISAYSWLLETRTRVKNEC